MLILKRRDIGLSCLAVSALEKSCELFIKSSHGDVTEFYMAYAAKFQFEPTLTGAALRMSGSFARFGCMFDFTKEFGRKCQVVI